MPPPVTDFKKAYQAFLDGTEPITDAMRKGARAYILLAVALGKVLSAQTLRVKGTADAMTRDHDYMSKLNDVIAVAGPSAAGNGTHYTVFTATNEKDMQDFRTAFLLAAKMGTTNPNDYIAYNNTPPNKYEWQLTVDECNTALKNLQFDVDDLNSMSQEQQLACNTLMSNLNNCIEAATSGIQKVGTQGQAAIRAFD